MDGAGRSTCRWIGVIAMCSLAAMAVVRGQSQPAKPTAAGPSLLIDSLAGRDTFDHYCAACHGRGGRGDGSVAASLKSRPPDLTTLTRRNSGVFPRDRVLAAVTNTNRPIAAHGTGDMPVWGQIFRALDPSTARVEVRLSQVVSYLESLQAPSAPSVEAGRQLFMTYCASCHGATGRGNGPVAAQIRQAIPDLTSFTMRNGGMFPSERVREIIDGRGIASHGDREMPVWGAVFAGTRNGGGDTVRTRIDALVLFLESIQTRATR